MSHARKLFYVDNSDYAFCYERCLAMVLDIYNFLNIPFDVTLSEPEFSKIQRIIRINYKQENQAQSFLLQLCR